MNGNEGANLFIEVLSKLLVGSQVFSSQPDTATQYHPLNKLIPNSKKSPKNKLHAIYG
jgi:hypothetical protein